MDIVLKNLSHVYGQGSPDERLALDEINLFIPSGSFTAVIGPSGSGKSTLVQHLNGLLRPTSGEARVGTARIAPNAKNLNLRDLRRKVGLVFQYPEYQLFEETVEKDIAFGLVNFDFPEELISVRVKEAMAIVGLDYERFRNRSPFELSGGQKRRVALAGVLALRPQVLILDEPTVGLDPQGKKDILNHIYKSHVEEKRTTILATHHMEDAAAYADQVVVLNEGRVFLEGTPREVFEKEAELRRIGLDLPEISRFVLKFNERASSPLPTDLFSMESLVEALLKRIKADKK